MTKGEIGVVKVTRSKTIKEEESLKIQKGTCVDDNSSIIDLYVPLASFVELTKCANLSTMSTIYLKNDFPICLEYDVGSLGFIRLGLASGLNLMTGKKQFSGRFTLASDQDLG